MRLIVCILLLAFSLHLSAHPSWGIVVLPDGVIYVADVLHNDGTLWKIENEEVTPFLSQFHAHDVQYANGALWIAENLWVEGKIEGEGRHSLVRIDKYENIDTVIVTDKRNVFNGTNFTVSNTGKIFFENEGQIYQYQKNRVGIPVINKKFKRVNTLRIDGSNQLWIAEKNDQGGTLFRFDGKELVAIATGIIDTTATTPLFKEDHLQIMTGIGFDGEGNVFVGENAGCRIVKVTPSGELSTFYQSPLLWSPSGISFQDGNAFIVEVGFNKGHNGPRLLKKTSSGQISKLARFDVLPKEENEGNAIIGGYSLPAWIFFTIFLTLFTILVLLSVKRQLQGGS